MDEVNINYDFELKCLMSLLSEDGAPATIKRKKDGKIFYTVFINDLHVPLRPYKSSFVKLDYKLDTKQNSKNDANQETKFAGAANTDADDTGSNMATDGPTDSDNLVGQGDSKNGAAAANKGGNGGNNKNEKDSTETSENKDEDDTKTTSQSTTTTTNIGGNMEDNGSGKTNTEGGNTAPITDNTEITSTNDTTTTTTTTTKSKESKDEGDKKSTDHSENEGEKKSGKTKRIKSKSKTKSEANKPSDVEMVGDRVLFKICGIIQGVRSADQEICLESNKLKEPPNVNANGSQSGETTTPNKNNQIQT